MKILIIDDEPEIVQFLKDGLEANLFNVETAADGERGAFLDADLDIAAHAFGLGPGDGRVDGAAMTINIFPGGGFPPSRKMLSSNLRRRRPMLLSWY